MKIAGGAKPYAPTGGSKRGEKATSSVHWVGMMEPIEICERQGRGADPQRSGAAFDSTSTSRSGRYGWPRMEREGWRPTVPC